MLFRATARRLRDELTSLTTLERFHYFWPDEMTWVGQDSRPANVTIGGHHATDIRQSARSGRPASIQLPSKMAISNAIAASRA